LSQGGQNLDEADPPSSTQEKSSETIMNLDVMDDYTSLINHKHPEKRKKQQNIENHKNTKYQNES